MPIPPLPFHPPPCEADGQKAGDHWVQARRLDGFAWPACFAYIKIDVDGADQLVLFGSEQLLRRQAPMLCSFEYLDTQQRLGPCKEAVLEAFALWEYQFCLYPPDVYCLVPFIVDDHGSWPRRKGDNVLAVHASALDQVVRRLSGVE